MDYLSAGRVIQNLERQTAGALSADYVEVLENVELSENFNASCWQRIYDADKFVLALKSLDSNSCGLRIQMFGNCNDEGLQRLESFTQILKLFIIHLAVFSADF